MTDDNFCIPCFEDDFEDIATDELLLILDKRGHLELNWKPINRRLPSPLLKVETKAESASNKEEPKNIEFDFMDDNSPQPQPLNRVRNSNTPLKGSAKKKTTNFSNVIDHMKKHGRFQSKDNRNSTGST